MRIPPNRRKTERGLGDNEEEIDPIALDDSVPPSSRRGLSCSAPSSVTPKPSGRYSLLPARADTLEMHAPRVSNAPGEAEPPCSRRATSRMPSCVEEAALASGALAKGTAASLIVRRLQTSSAVELTPHDRFVLSFLDRTSSMQALIEATAMRDAKVAEVLDRLAGLGLVALD